MERHTPERRGGVNLQYYLDGFRGGDPDIKNAAPGRRDRGPNAPLPKEVDVVIVGTGPAGLCLAAQLAQFPEIDTMIIESSPCTCDIQRLILVWSKDGREILGNNTTQDNVCVGNGQVSILSVAHWARVGSRTFGSNDEHSSFQKQTASTARCNCMNV